MFCLFVDLADYRLITLNSVDIFWTNSQIQYHEKTGIEIGFNHSNKWKWHQRKIQLSHEAFQIHSKLESWKIQLKVKSIYSENVTEFERNHPLRYHVYYFRARIQRQNTNHSASEAALSSRSPDSQTKLNGLVLSSRNPDLPVTSLPGPPVPPRSYSQIHLDTMQQNSMYSTLFILFWLNKTRYIFQSNS